MNTTEQNRYDETICDNNSFALAVAVIRERVERLDEMDKQDLYDLLPHVFSGDDEERGAAQSAINEILDQECFAVKRLELPDSPGEELAGWIAFVSAKIKELRKSAGMTQEQLSEKSKIPQSHISRLEKGEHSPTAKTIRRLAEAMGIDAKEIDPSAQDEV